MSWCCRDSLPYESWIEQKITSIFGSFFSEINKLQKLIRWFFHNRSFSLAALHWELATSFLDSDSARLHRRSKGWFYIFISNEIKLNLLRKRCFDHQARWGPRQMSSMIFHWCPREIWDGENQPAQYAFLQWMRHLLCHHEWEYTQLNRIFNEFFRSS